MTPRAAGEGNPVASNDNPEGRATNRRVLISIVQ
jgi:outer membrane protein OmpA-like peptidoglycan-associated protein